MSPVAFLLVMEIGVNYLPNLSRIFAISQALIHDADEEDQKILTLAFVDS